MGRIILLLLLSVGAYAQSPRPLPVYSMYGAHIIAWQPAPIPGYTKINARYQWIAGAFDSTLSVPYGTTASLRTLGYNAPGALFFQTSDSSLYAYTGTQWRVVSGGAAGWELTGNAGTTAGTNFIGTTDAVSVMFKFNSLKSGLIDSAKEEASFGYRTLQNSTGTFNTALGFKALSANTFATNNTAIGKKAMLNNTEGDGNTVVGSDALYSNTLGSDNAAFGVDALFSNLSGTNNAAFGNNSLYFNTGEFNTGIGGSSGSTITTGNDNLVVGFSAANGLTTGSNNTVLGNQSVTTTTLTNSVLIGHGVSGSVNGRMVISDSITSYKLPNIPSGVGTKTLRYDPSTGLLTYVDTIYSGRWKARVGSTTSSATPTINTDNVDIYKLTAQAADITSFTTNLTGTPNDGDILEIQITGTAARAITWGSSFVSSTVTLPTTTVTTATLTVVVQYFTTSSYGNNKWVCVNSF